jgi:MFS transporter, SP family, xylose:H+ symportor
MNKKAIYYSIVVSITGFLFGFDTVVISGANLPIKALWGTSAWFHGLFIMSVALWGTVVGALFGGIPCDKMGRKTTLFWIGVLYLVSALGTALATDPYVFSVYRFLGGLAIGVSTIAAPTYITEISPSRHRGKLVGLFQINIVTGILAAYISNYLLGGFGGKSDWRWMLGAEAIPALVFLSLILYIPESPRWLVLHKGEFWKASKVLTLLYDPDTIKPAKLLEKIQKGLPKAGLATNYCKNHGHLYVWAFLIAFFNQTSGINFILYYAPEIMEGAGFGTQESLLGAVCIGIVNLVFTLWGLILIDRSGRKPLMLVGSFGYLVSLGMVSAGFYFGLSPVLSLIALLIFIAAHAVGQGTVIWVFIAEIFPNQIRAKGQSFGALTHWTMAALITLGGSVLISKLLAWQIFLIFWGFMLLQSIFVIGFMPETKGRSLENQQPTHLNESFLSLIQNKNY